MKERIKKLKVQKALIKLLTGAIAVSGAGIAIGDLRSEVPDVCDVIFSEIANQCGIDKDMPSKLKNMIEKSNENNKHEETILAKKDLRIPKYLKVDVLKTNIEDLKKLPRLKQLELSNYKYLTDEDKRIIGDLNLEELTLTIDKNDIMNPSMYDTSFINPKTNVIFKAPVTGLNELQRLYYYLIKQKYEDLPRVSFPSLNDYEIDEIKAIQERLESIVASFGFNENTTDEEKIITITKYVTDKIEYDPDVESKINPKLVKELLDKYNEDVLSSILDGTNEERKGVCCNYAGLESTLGYYSGVNISFARSYDKDIDHAWNEYNGFYIDPTILDDNVYYNKLKELYDKTNGFTISIPGLEEDLDTYKEEYERLIISNNNVHIGDIKPTKQVTYFKYNAAKDYNRYKEDKARINVYISMIATLLLIVELYLENKKKKKQ